MSKKEQMTVKITAIMPSNMGEDAVFIPLEVVDGDQIMSGPEAFVWLQGVFKPMGILVSLEEASASDMKLLGYEAEK